MSVWRLRGRNGDEADGELIGGIAKLAVGLSGLGVVGGVVIAVAFDGVGDANRSVGEIARRAVQVRCS